MYLKRRKIKWKKRNVIVQVNVLADVKKEKNALVKIINALVDVRENAIVMKIVLAGVMKGKNVLVVKKNKIKSYDLIF